MKIKSISDVITNSSNETYIIKNDGLLLSWNKLLSEWFFEPFDRDELVIFIEYKLKKKLIDNPCEVKSINDIAINKNGWRGRYYTGPWKLLQMTGLWTDEEIEDLWKEFVLKNEEVFKEAITYGLVYGPEDNQYSDWYEWDSDCESYRDESIMYAGRDCSIFDEYIWENWLENIKKIEIDEN